MQSSQSNSSHDASFLETTQGETGKKITKKARSLTSDTQDSSQYSLLHLIVFESNNEPNQPSEEGFTIPRHGKQWHKRHLCSPSQRHITSLRLPGASVPRLPALGQPNQRHQRADRGLGPALEGRRRLARLVSDWRSGQRHQHGGLLQAGSDGRNQRVPVRLGAGRLPQSSPGRCSTV